jgi:transketolase
MNGSEWDSQCSSLEELAEAAKCMRVNIIRMTHRARSGHPGPSLSIVDILAVLYLAEMRIDLENPAWSERDRIVLSKGHAAPGLYAAMQEVGLISEEQLFSLREIGSPLQGHPSSLMPGVDASTGSLGTGLSIAVGIALGLRMRSSNARVYAIVGDGECDEGQIWEAALAAAHFALGNLVAFVDRNRYQVDGPTCEVMTLDPLADKWRAFGWRVREIDGHDYQEILSFLKWSRENKDQPSMAVAETVKGCGVSFMEGNNTYHARPPNDEEAARALAELKA